MALIKPYQDKTPHWGKNCYFSENSTLVGDVILGDDCSVWFSAVIRADVEPVRIGSRTNIQDLACIHQSGGYPVIIGDDVTIGHSAVVHSATIHDGALIGMNSTVLDGAVVGHDAIVAAGAVVLQGTHIPPGEIWGGVPARKLKDADPGKARELSKHYLYYKEQYKFLG